MIPPILLMLYESVYLPVLVTRSYLVAQQHDDHILLGVLVYLRQPRLKTKEKKVAADENKYLELRFCIKSTAYLSPRVHIGALSTASGVVVMQTTTGNYDWTTFPKKIKLKKRFVSVKLR